jgi:SAM-dependent methyltransferase
MTTDEREGVADAHARLYDVDLQEDPGDLDLYLALAARTGGPILELGVGTGRIAVPLAAAGYRVTGVDLDAAMLRRAREHATRAGRQAAKNLTLIEADARDLPEDLGPFRLAFVALNSLLIFGSRKDQARAVAGMADRLEPGGLAVVDVWLPHAEDLARYDGRLGLEYVRRDAATGLDVTKLASALHDTATATVDLTTIFDEGSAGEPPRRWIRRDRLRLVGAGELRSFAEEAGLRVEVIAGDYDLTPIGPGDDRAILVAERLPAASGTSRRRTGIASQGPPAARRTGSGARSGLV